MDKYAKKYDQCSQGMNSGYVDVDNNYCSDYCLTKANKIENPNEGPRVNRF